MAASKLRISRKAFRAWCLKNKTVRLNEECGAGVCPLEAFLGKPADYIYSNFARLPKWAIEFIDVVDSSWAGAEWEGVTGAVAVKVLDRG